MIYLELINLKTYQTFKKYFKNEHDKNVFKNKLRYSKKLKVIFDVSDQYN